MKKEKGQEKLLACLQQTLVDLTSLSLQTKQAHWNVRGPHFRSLHLQLDDITASVRDWLDEVAERIVTLNAPADGRVGTVHSASKLPEFPAGFIKDRQVLDLISERINATLATTRAACETAGDCDPISEDLLIEVIGGLEKHLWMIDAQRE